MKRHSIFFVMCGLLLSATALAPCDAWAQVDEIPEAMRVRHLPQQHLSGPRFGATMFTSDVADYRSARGQSSMMSQFGWQFEKQLVSTTRGSQALLEWVFLLGGVEQDEFNVGVSWLAGYRLPNGFEFGVGPHVGFSGISDATTSMVVATGATVPFGEIYVPINAAVAFADGGPRITALLGWIVG
jgi:hypothetical protein